VCLWFVALVEGEKNLKFLSIYTPDPKTAGGPPSQEHMAVMGKLIEDGMKEGWLISTGGLMPVAQGGGRVRRSGGQISVVDGPFAETKEVIAGYAIIQADSKDAATELTKRFLAVAGDGECSLRQIMGAGE
jgi:hypothetical protein